MILRLFALLFCAGALLLGLFGGWSWSFGDLLMQVNSRALLRLHDFVGTTLWSGAWDSLVGPVLFMPAWVVPSGIALILFTISAFQPARA